jgi:hypothetical protein
VNRSGDSRSLKAGTARNSVSLDSVPIQEASQLRSLVTHGVEMELCDIDRAERKKRVSVCDRSLAHDELQVEILPKASEHL